LYFCTKKIMPFHWQKSNLFIVTFRGWTNAFGI
jgi:hypothetical protein